MKWFSMLMRFGIPAVLLAASAAPAQKTEVRVLKGAVKAETGSTTVRVDAGQKVVLAQEKEPIVRIDDLLVRERLEMDKGVQAEKARRQAAGLRVDDGNVGIGSADNDGISHSASLGSLDNPAREPSRRLRIGPTSRELSSGYYEISGKPIPVDIEKAGPDTDYHYLNLSEPVPPGGSVRVIHTATGPVSEDFWHEGKIWYSVLGDGTPYDLAYRRIILPKSAILVDFTLAPTEITSVEGRTMLTFRKYSGQDGSEGNYSIAFLWPDKDGTSLADLPQYRGLTDGRNDALAEEYRQAIPKILQGQAYADQSTPVRCLLTWYSAIFRQDKDLLARCIDPHNGNAHAFAQGLSADDWERMQRTAKIESFLGTPPWPDSPQDSYKHPIFLSRPGTRIRTETMYFAWHDGKWYRNGNAGNPRDDGTYFQKRQAPAGAK